MKNLLFVLILIFQQSFLFAQSVVKPSLKNYYSQDFRSHLPRNSPMERLKSSSLMNSTLKANTITLSLPDTIIEYSLTDTTRSIHTYDENGNFLYWLSQSYLNHVWVNVERESYTYDANGNFLTELYEEWENNNWKNIFKGTHTYDENGYSITSIYEDWIDNSWVVKSQYRTTNIYDTSNNLLSETGEKYMDGEWGNAYKYSYTYDSNGNMLTYLGYIYGSDPWEPETKTSYNYDSNNNLLTKSDQRYSSNGWSNGVLWTFDYNSDGSVSKKLYHDLEYYDAPYSLEYDTVNYEYDSNGNLLSLGESQKYTYDSNGNLLTWDFFTWNTNSKQWEKKWEEPCDIFIKTTYSGKIWNYQVQKFGNGILFLTYGSGNKMIFHWTQVEVTGIYNTMGNNNITIFPNPASTVLNIKGIQDKSIAKIYSMDGKQMLTNVISGNNQILNVSQLKNGIYILKIETPKGSVMKKFIKQ